MIQTARPVYQGLWRSATTGTVIKTISKSSSESVTLDVAIHSMEKATKQAFDDFVASMRAVEAVEQVRGKAAGTYLHLVTYVSESSKEERFAIYEAEKQLHKRYGQMLDFEFDLIDRRGYAVEEAEIDEKYIEIIRKRPDHNN